jgi:uncharacterized protein (TIGR03085 family)
MAPYPTGVDETPLDARERAELCDLFASVGPDAPTLCEGWTTADLAAHLVVREHDPRSGPGILLGGRFGEYTEKLMARAKGRGYERLVETIREGPPAVPWRIPRLRTMLNLNEYAVHHEDVRRANGLAPRTDRPDLQDALWGMLQRGAGMMLRKVKGTGVELVRPDGDVVRARKGTPVARISGEPLEILLHLFGRGAHAQVEVGGDPEAVAILSAADLGL